MSSLIIVYIFYTCHQKDAQISPANSLYSPYYAMLAKLAWAYIKYPAKI